MHADLLFPSKYIKAPDLMGKEVTVTIKETDVGHKIETSRGNVPKPVMYFRGKDKGLVLNKTKVEVIKKLYGTETDDWDGKKIIIKAGRTKYKGEMVDCINIVNRKPRSKQQEPAAAAPPQAPDEPPQPEPEANEQQPAQEGVGF